MVEVKLGPRTVDLPYTIRLYGITEEMFDELTDEDTKAELLDGIMIVYSPLSPRHDYVADFLRTLMSCYAEEKDLGLVLGPDVLIHLAACRKFTPDIFFFRQERVPRPLHKKQFESAPDLVVEVLSSSNRSEDMDDKRPAYRQAKVGEIWFVDPDMQEIIIDCRGKRGYTTDIVTQGKATSKVLPGFWVHVAWLWAEPLPKRMACLREIFKADQRS